MGRHISINGKVIRNVAMKEEYSEAYDVTFRVLIYGETDKLIKVSEEVQV